MKILQILFFIALTLPTFGQDKADLINCLDLIFDQSEFQSAYSSHEATDGNVIIVQSGSGYRMGRNPNLNDLLNSFSNDDFRATDNYVKVLNSNELEYQGIPQPATLTLFASGTATDMVFRLETILFDERQQYSWNYRLSKIDEEWEISARDLSKIGVKLSEY